MCVCVYSAISGSTIIFFEYHMRKNLKNCDVLELQKLDLVRCCRGIFRPVRRPAPPLGLPNRKKACDHWWPLLKQPIFVSEHGGLCWGIYHQLLSLGGGIWPLGSVFGPVWPTLISVCNFWPFWGAVGHFWWIHRRLLAVCCNLPQCWATLRN